MTFYFDRNHPIKLIEALQLIYNLDVDKHRFVQYTSDEYETAATGAVYFLVDDEKKGVDFNTLRIVNDGNTVFALKFKKEDYYVPFEVAQAVLKIWSRALARIAKAEDRQLYKYYYKTDKIVQVQV